MNKKQFETIKNRFGKYSSFAIWKSDDCVYDISFFDDDNVLKQINTKYVFIALNPAEHPKNKQIRPFSNFHSDYSYQKDFKLCYALHNTKFWGSYITDLFKSFELTDSSELTRELKKRPDDIEKDKNALREELSMFDKDVILIALSRKTEKYLHRLFGNEYKIVYAIHYASYSSKEEYKERLIRMLEDQNV